MPAHRRAVRARARSPTTTGTRLVRQSEPSASRAVRAGSSASTVPVPTTIASASARRRCTSARAAGPVIHWLVPSDAAARPSRLCAHLTVTCGRPRRCTASQDASSAVASSASTPDSTSTPAARRRSPPPDDSVAGIGDGVDDARDAGGDERLRSTDRCGPCGCTARASRPPSRRARRPARASTARRPRRAACRRRGASPRRGPRRRARGCTAPTCGFTPRGPLSASASARRIALALRVVSPSSVSFLAQAPGKGERRRAPRARAASHPDSQRVCLLHHRRFRNSTGSAAACFPKGAVPWLADCHRRFGFSPTPEHVDALECSQRTCGWFIPCRRTTYARPHAGRSSRVACRSALTDHGTCLQAGAGVLGGT